MICLLEKGKSTKFQIGVKKNKASQCKAGQGSAWQGRAKYRTISGLPAEAAC
jgi:hypothetical protein